MLPARLSRGLRVPFTGFAYLRQHPALWPFVLPAALVNVLITGVALAVLIVAWVLLVGWVLPMFGEGVWQTLLKVLVLISTVMVVVGLTVLFWLLMQNVIAGHLLSKLAERVEAKLGLKPGEIASVPFAWQVRDGAVDTAVVAGIHGSAFALQFLPVVGTLVGVPAALLADALVFGSDFMSHPLKLRGMSFAQRRAFIRRHLSETMGIGMVTLPLGLVPVLGGFVTAAALVGTVLLHRELAEAAGPAQQPAPAR